MLDNLIETTDDGRQSKRMRGILMTVGSAMSVLFVSGLIFSIFSTSLAMSSEGFDLTRLISPAAIPEPAPAPPVESRAEPTTSSKQITRLPQRVQNIQRTSESPVLVPKNVSTVKGKYKERPVGAFVLTAADKDGSGPTRPNTGQKTGTSSKSIAGNAIESEPVKIPEVKKVVPPPPSLTAVKKDVVVTGGVMNGKAKNLVKPVYSQAAIAAGVKGSVTVSILISESGRVISANVSNGHPLLRQAATTAARRTTFTPTTLSNVPVKVQGVIVYNFN